MRRLRSTGRLAAALLGWLTIVVLVDLAAGLLLGLEASRPVGAERFDLEALAEGRVVQDDEETMRAADAPAMRDAPWAPSYWEEFVRMRWDPGPYGTGQPSDVSGSHINVHDGLRASYVAPGTPEDAPEVWVFGGSTTWGQGQRDEHTIPSELARIAATEGAPLRVRNMGVLGDTAWQELHRVVAALEARPAPALIVFYDGINETATTYENATIHPTHYLPDREPILETLQEDLQVLGSPREPTWWEQGWEVSLLGKLVRRTSTAVSGAPADAQELPPGEADPVDWVRRSTDIYVRARTLISAAVADAGVPAVFFAQPGPSEVNARFAASVGPPTVDISDAFDGHDPDDLYIDGAHTNELGAQLAAQAMWPVVRSSLPSA
jgi:lysophospholipase L1-like esterase